MDILSKKNGLN